MLSLKEDIYVTSCIVLLLILSISDTFSSTYEKHILCDPEGSQAPDFSWTSSDSLASNYKEVPILDSKGETVFLARFNENGTRIFSATEKEAIKEGFVYWSRILQKAPNGNPGIISIRASEVTNAHYFEERDLLRSFLGE